MIRSILMIFILAAASAGAYAGDHGHNGHHQYRGGKHQNHAIPPGRYYGPPVRIVAPPRYYAPRPVYYAAPRWYGPRYAPVVRYAPPPVYVPYPYYTPSPYAGYGGYSEPSLGIQLYLPLR